MKESGDARKLAVKLKGLKYGDQLRKDLMEESAHCEGLYEEWRGLLKDKRAKDDKYKALHEKIKEKLESVKSTEATDPKIRRLLFVAFSRRRLRALSRMESEGRRRRERPRLSQRLPHRDRSFFEPFLNPTVCEKKVYG